MSTILKALRRVESDKNSQVKRPLREEVASGAETRRRFPVVWVAAGVFTAGIGIGAAALFLWPGDLFGPGSQPKAASPAAAPVAGPKAPARAVAAPRPRPTERPRRSTPRRAPAGSPTAAASPAAPPAGGAPPAAAPPVAGTPPDQDVEVVRQLTPTPLRISESGPAPGTPHPPAPGEVRPGAEAMKPRHRPAPSRPPAQVVAAVPSPAPEPAPSPPPKAAPSAAPPAPDATAARLAAAREPEPAPPPDRPEPPAVHRRAGVPVILVSRTLWHPKPERREALIEVETDDGGVEKRRVHEGDAVGSLRVERIDPSGVVFDYDGVELRHAVGSGS